MPETKYRSPWSAADSETQIPATTAMPQPRHSRRWSVAILFFTVFLGVVAYYYFTPQTAAPAISVDVQDPGTLLVGEPVTLAVAVSNLSEETLANSRLSLFLPDDLSLLNAPPEQRFAERVIGDLGPGSIRQESFSVVVTGVSESIRRVEARFAYTLAKNPKVQFEKQSEMDLRVGEPAVLLSFDTPEKVVSGEDFNVTVTYTNNGKEPLQNVRLIVQYPSAFQFVTSTMPTEATSTNIWGLGTLGPGGTGTVAFTGRVYGAPASIVTISGTLAARVAGTPYDIARQSANMTVAPPPLSLAITVNGEDGAVARLGDMLRYEIGYRNDSSVTLQNVTLQAKLEGDIFDFSSAQTNAVFDSIQNVFTWSPASMPDFQNLRPGGSGIAHLTIRLTNRFPVTRASDKNFKLRLEAEMSSPTVPPNTAARRTFARTFEDTPVRGSITVDALGLWRDAVSKVLNTGPYPPRANQTTQYSIHWVVRTFGVDFTNVRVAGKLESGARFVRVVSSNAPAEPSWNPSTGVVTWNVGNVSANRGFGGNPVQAVFQIEQTPAVNQVGSDLVLMDQILLYADDVFVNASTSVTAEPMTTALRGDPTITTVDRRVQP